MGGVGYGNPEDSTRGTILRSTGSHGGIDVRVSLYHLSLFARWLTFIYKSCRHYCSALTGISREMVHRSLKLEQTLEKVNPIVYFIYGSFLISLCFSSQSTSNKDSQALQIPRIAIPFE